MKLFLSPHFDDVAYACGGWVHTLARAGQPVHVLTVCAGEPAGEPAGPLTPFAESLHHRWGTTAATTLRTRRAEDQAALRVLGAPASYLTIPDCIYRQAEGQALYASEAAIFGTVHPLDAPTRAHLTAALRQLAPQHVIAPLGIGGHVDHALVRQAVEDWGGPVWFYEDCPYAMRTEPYPEAGWGTLTAGLTPFTLTFDDAALHAHCAASAAYASQLSTFWASVVDMEHAFRAFLRRPAGWGVRVWAKTP